MKKSIFMGVLPVFLSVMSLVAYAQNEVVGQKTNVSAENQAFSEAISQGQTEVLSQPQIEVVNDVADVAPVQVQQTQQQVQQVVQPQIVQQQPTIFIQKQPTTVVEDSPLTESAADKMRRQRVEIEQQTESKIVEKLELERIKAEQDRAEKIMSSFDKKEEEKKIVPEVTTAVVAPAIEAPVVQVVAPAVQAEPVIEVKSELSKLDEKKVEDTRMYMALDMGLVTYPSVDNVRMGAGIGFTVGYSFEEQFQVEGNFLYAKSDIENATGAPDLFNPTIFYPDIISMGQYGFSGTFKYRVMKTKFSPVVGALASYTYRDYATKQCASAYASGYPCTNLDATSSAIDAGLLIGGDLRLTDRFSIGADFKYIFNIAYEVKQRGGALEPSRIIYSDYRGSSIEELNYYNFLVHAKLTF